MVDDDMIAKGETEEAELIDCNDKEMVTISFEVLRKHTDELDVI